MAQWNLVNFYAGLEFSFLNINKKLNKEYCYNLFTWISRDKKNFKLYVYLFLDKKIQKDLIN